MDYSTFRRFLGYRIRLLRKEKGFTQEQLAELVDKTTDHISYLERGEHSPSFEFLIDLAQALNVSLSSLSSLLEITPSEKKFDVSMPAPIPLSLLPKSDPGGEVKKRYGNSSTKMDEI